MLSFFLFAACDGSKTTKSDADAADDTTLTDEDLMTDELIPDEEEDTEPTDMDTADKDVTDKDTTDKDIIDHDTIDEDTVEGEPDLDTPPGDETEVEPDEDGFTDPCTPNPCTAIAHSDGVCTVVGAGYTCGCTKNYHWDGTACVLQPVIYVNHAATGTNDGTSWQDAFTDLSEAIDGAVSGQEIWVAAGTYTPTLCASTAQETCEQRPRNRTFTLKSGIALYGGFSGAETTRDERDWEVNETILSGDFNGDDVWDGAAWQNREENAYHVMQVIWDNKSPGDALLDGFTLTHGYANADDPQGVEGRGGGLDATDNENSGDLIIRNCIFRDNYAIGGGGASFANMAPLIENVLFTANEAESGGGALNLSNSEAVVNGTDFDENISHGGGGAILAANGGTLSLSSCFFTGNTAEGNGGALDVHSTDITITSSVFVGNAVTGSSSSEGGAISLEDGVLIITGTAFLGNYADAGVSTINCGNAHISVSDSIFEQNTSSADGDKAATFLCNNGSLDLSLSLFSENIGSAVSLQNCEAAIINSDFRENSAVNGGALSKVGTGDLTVSGCFFEHNYADIPGSGFAGIGGALFINGMDATGSETLTVVNSVFDGNEADFWGGAATLLMASPIFTNCTFANNTDGSDTGVVFIASNATFNNTILWEAVRQVINAGPYNFPPSNPTFRFSNIYGSGGSSNDCGIGGDEPCWALPFGTDGGGNIDADPLFVGSGNDPLDLQSGSSCVNTGSNALVPADVTTDILGDPRIQNGTVDMGAYEQ